MRVAGEILYVSLLRGPCSSSAGYLRKHIVRKFLLSATQQSSEETRADFKRLHWGDLAPAIPDTGEHTATLREDASWGEIEDIFGLHPVMVPCWACLLAAVPDDKQAWFRNASPALLEKGLAMSQASGMAPTPETIAGAVRSRP